jgi:hypothetical protein
MYDNQYDKSWRGALPEGIYTINYNGKSSDTLRTLINRLEQNLEDLKHEHQRVTHASPTTSPLVRKSFVRKFLSLFLFLALSFGAANAVTHSTVITITPPAAQTGVTITKFNVYKALSSGAYTLGVPTASVTANGTAPVVYTDTAAVSGQKTFFVTTSVCPTCTTTESVVSNEISGTTPVDLTVPDKPVLSGVWN